MSTPLPVSASFCYQKAIFVEIGRHRDSSRDMGFAVSSFIKGQQKLCISLSRSLGGFREFGIWNAMSVLTMLKITRAFALIPLLVTGVKGDTTVIVIQAGNSSATTNFPVAAAASPVVDLGYAVHQAVINV